MKNAMIDGIDTKDLSILPISLSSDTTIHITQRQTIGETGDTVWAAGSCLARYLYHTYRHSSRTENKKHAIDLRTENRKYAIELGTGSGITGISLALGLIEAKAKWDIILTDLSNIIENGVIRENLIRNLPLSIDNNVKVSYRILNWKEKWDFIPFQEINLIISSDCIYSMEMVEPFVETLEWLASSSTRIIIGLERRDTLVIDEWLLRASKSFTLLKLSSRKVRKICQQDQSHQSHDVEIYTLKLKRQKENN